MELFRKKVGTVFLKEMNSCNDYISKLESLYERAEGSLRQEIEQQIKYARHGAEGERNIAFELKNSDMDMFVLHDLYFENEGLSAQIDYLVITRKVTFIIECKNLYGNIKIDNKGTFIRMQQNGKEIGIYSPITQNERHLKMIKRVRADAKNILSRGIFEKNFDNYYKAVVVLANPQTVLYDRYAPREIKEKVIRYDQLVNYIQNVNEESKAASLSTEEMKKLAEFYLAKDLPNKTDYTQKYQKLLELEQKSDVNKKECVIHEEEKRSMEPTEKEKIELLIPKLKEYRLQQSRENNIKPYYIFNDAQMNDLLQKMPKNKEELLKVAGFGEAKVEKYGEAILKIIGS